MTAECLELSCAVCGEDGIKSFWVGMEGDQEWHRWCDSCIVSGVSKLQMVIIHPTDFLKIPPEDSAHPFYMHAESKG